jgi:hypothetical protein
MKCPVEIFDTFPYPEEVDPEDRATLKGWQKLSV